jgi:hypothetical protein
MSALELRENPRRFTDLLCTWFVVLLIAALGIGSVGCDPEMPMPPQRKSTNPAEDSFHWAMERMEHAIEMFQPPSSLGLHVKHSVEHKLFPPKTGKPNYTASVIISTKAVFNHAPGPSAKERRKAQEDKAREAAKKLGLDDPFGPSDEERLTKDPLAMDEPGSVEMGTADIADPVVPAQQITEKKKYDLEYVDDEWKLATKSVEDNERMWFEYALQQGEFAPASSTEK